MSGVLTRVPIIFLDPGDRTPSSFLSKLGKKLKVPTDKFNGLFSVGRSVIDALAMSVGIPAASVRQELGHKGIDPDGFEQYLQAAADQQPGEHGAPWWNEQMRIAAERNQKMEDWKVLGLVALCAAVFLPAALRTVRGVIR